MEFLYNDIFFYYEAAIILFISLSAFFSGTETALVTANIMTIESLAEKGNKKAKRSLFILNNIEKTISMILIGNNIVNIAAASFIAFVAKEAYNLNISDLFIVSIIQTLIFLILCEVTPKIVARGKAESFLMTFSLPLKIVMIIFSPAIKVSLLVSYGLKRKLKIKEEENAFVRSKDEIDIFFKIGGQEGVIDRDHHVYVSEILSLKQTPASEIMTPTIDIVSIEVNSSIKELVDLIVDTKFARIPVYQDRVDNIIGYIFYRDLIKTKGTKKLSDLMYKVYYIPETKNIYELHLEMQENILPIVFVVNEYGAVVGMVTHEDIAEEIVGEIQAHDQSKENLITEVSKKRYLVQGDLDIDFFMRLFPLKLEKIGFKTLAGFLTSQLGKIPKKGDRFKYEKFVFIIEESTERSVERVVVVSPVDISGKIKV